MINHHLISILGGTMPLVGPKEMFARAYAESYAVGAFNINNMEIIQGIMQAASEEKSPVILQVSAGARKYAGQPYIMKLAEAALQENDLPMVVHLDHGADFEICKACIDGGFTSVMIDGSHHSFEENIAITKKVVDYAHDKGVWVEAELGQLAGVEEHVSAEKSVYTDPDQAVEFVQRSGCDSLAIAIGTSHGAYKFKGEAKLGSAKGVPEEMLRKAASMGVCKINIDSDIRLAMTAYIRRQLAESPEEFDPRSYLKPAREAVRTMVQHKIKNVLGSSNKI